MSGRTLSADMLSLELTDKQGTIWGKFVCVPTTFKSGSIGFILREKIDDPYDHKKRFQVNLNMTLIGSKDADFRITDT